MPVTNVWAATPSTAGGKTSGTTLAGAIAPSASVIQAGDILGIMLVCDNFNTGPLISGCTVNTVETPGGTSLHSTSRQYSCTVTDTTGTAAAQSLYFVDLTPLAGQTFSTTAVAYNLTLNNAVTAKVTCAMLYRGGDHALLSSIVNAYTSGSAPTFPSTAALNTNGRVTWLAAQEGITAPTLTAVGSNSAHATGGGAAVTNIAGRWAYSDSPAAASRSTSTITRGGLLGVYIPEKAATTVYGCGLPI